MKQPLSKYVILAVLPILFMISACAGHGKLSSLPRSETNDLLADLLTQIDRYMVHYHGNSETIVSGILFDPKEDGKHILPEGMLWKEINDPETIASIISAIQQSYFPGYHPRLFKVNDPQGGLYGYLFTGWSYMVIRRVDEQTLRVYGLKGPPEYEDMYPAGH